MTTVKKANYSILEIISLLVFIALAGYIWWGFFYPDPFTELKFNALYIAVMSWGSRIFIPLIVVGFLFVYHGTKTGTISGSNLALLIGSLILGALLLYPIGTFLHSGSADIQKKLNRYHPYLQLKPPVLSTEESVKDSSSFQIMCLGGSTTEYRDSKKRGWPSRVQESLREHYGHQQLRVYNMGMQWYTTLHSMINYQTNLRHHQPDAIIIMHSINDLLHNADFSYFSNGKFRDDYGHFNGPVTRLIKRESFLGSILSKFSAFWYHQPREVIDTDKFQGLNAFERNLNTMIDLAQKDGTLPILMTQPFLLRADYTPEEAASFYMINNEAIGRIKKWNVETGLRGMQQYNDAVRRVAIERSIPLIDLEPVVPKSLEYFTDDVHYADPAFDLIGKTVSRRLTEILTGHHQLLQ